MSDQSLVGELSARCAKKQSGASSVPRDKKPRRSSQSGENARPSLRRFAVPALVSAPSPGVASGRCRRAGAREREADAPIGAGRRGARRDVSRVSPEPGPGPDVPKNPKTRRAMAFSERTRGPSTRVEAGRDVDVSRASASRTAEPRRATCSYLLVGLAVLRRPRELRGAKAEVKQALALGVEEQVGLRVHLGQAHAVTGIDLQAREPAHLGLENHLAPLCVERTFARQREGRGVATTGLMRDARKHARRGKNASGARRVEGFEGNVAHTENDEKRRRVECPKR